MTIFGKKIPLLLVLILSYITVGEVVMWAFDKHVCHMLGLGFKPCQYGIGGTEDQEFSYIFVFLHLLWPLTLFWILRYGY